MTETEKEILSIAQEECAEVIQAISKVFRFGFDGKHPNENTTNLDRLEEEIGDLQCMFNIMLEFNLIRGDKLRAAEYKKLAKLKQWSNIYKEGNKQ